jgi:hypothetical protein
VLRDSRARADGPRKKVNKVCIFYSGKFLFFRNREVSFIPRPDNVILVPKLYIKRRHQIRNTGTQEKEKSAKTDKPKNKIQYTRNMENRKSGKPENRKTGNQ